MWTSASGSLSTLPFTASFSDSFHADSNHHQSQSQFGTKTIRSKCYCNLRSPQWAMFSSPLLAPRTPLAKPGHQCSWNASSCSKKREQISSTHCVRPTQAAHVLSVKDLFEFICSGPLISKLKISEESVAESIDKWLFCGAQLCRLFNLNELQLSTPQKSRIFHYYIPVFVWCEEKIASHRSRFQEGDQIPPLLIGFSAPQGCGKTTLVFALEYLFKITDRNAVSLSIDDFYLTNEDQRKLREANSGNSLLEYRGNAGSHDIDLSVSTLTAITNLTKEATKTKIPRYDKSAYNGRGDRADPSTWPEAKGPLVVALFEGWMLGFKPLPVQTIRSVDPQLEIVNENLKAYYEAWDKFVNAWVVVKINDPSCVYEWRLQAEIAMRADGKPAMTDDEVRDFVSRYLPAYKAYLPTLYSEGPNGSSPDDVLLIEIDQERNPILAT